VGKRHEDQQLSIDSKQIQTKIKTMKKRFEGTVIWYDDERGYGIIRLRSSRQTVSIDRTQIHYSNEYNLEMVVGRNVSFEICNIEAHNLYFS